MNLSNLRFLISVARLVISLSHFPVIISLPFPPEKNINISPSDKAIPANSPSMIQFRPLEIRAIKTVNIETDPTAEKPPNSETMNPIIYPFLTPILLIISSGLMTFANAYSKIRIITIDANVTTFFM